MRPSDRQFAPFPPCAALSFTVIAAVLTLSGPVAAADLDSPVLRGAFAAPESATTDWSGFYVGGHGGFTNSQVNFNNGTRAILNDLLQRTELVQEANVQDIALLQRRSKDSGGYGIFAGFNWQWDDVVLGFEADYTRTNLGVSSGGSLARQFTSSTEFLYNYTVFGDANNRVTDIATVRVRAGWAYGSFLPYITGGLAIANGSTSIRAGATGTITDVATTTITNSITGVTTVVPLFNPPRVAANTPFSEVQSRSNRSSINFGYVLGAGLDWALTSNVFLRVEGSTMRFGSFDDATVSINTARAGLGVKF